MILLPLHLLAFFVTCLVCHGELARGRPATQHLTEYYLWISFGGMLGGFFNGFLAPLIFTRVQEYPLAIIMRTAKTGLPSPSSAPRCPRLTLPL
jgi:hypothetical protein